MSGIMKLTPKDYDNFVTIVANAYPGFGIVTEKDRNELKKRLIKYAKEPLVHLFGYFRQGKIMGGMVLYDFMMNFLSVQAKMGGVGLVATDLLHKKEKICKKMLTYFLEYYREKDACLVALHPFRPDFYKKMGFGYGTKMNQYRIRPADLPRGKSKRHISFLKKSDIKALNECYRRSYLRNHGLLDRKYLEWGFLFDRPENKIIGYKDAKTILGYLVLSFKKAKKDNWLENDMVIREFIYEDREVFLELLTFLHTQLDQVNSIIYTTQDENFHYVPFDPRDGSRTIIGPLAHETNTQGIGIMYRVINVKGIFKLLNKHNFGNQNCRLKLTVIDSFFKKNQGSSIVHFDNGRAHLKKKADFEVEMCLDISDFSSLIMGVIDVRSLYRYGLVDISHHRYVAIINRMFKTEEKPVCTTLF